MCNIIEMAYNDVRDVAASEKEDQRVIRENRQASRRSVRVSPMVLSTKTGWHATSLAGKFNASKLTY